MSGKLTAQDIRIMLIELDLAEINRRDATTHATNINAVRQALLRAALGEVTVETEGKA
jgi:hypothetical protein